MPSSLPLDEAVALTRTGDLWLFRGRSPADQAIRAVTNSPVNHVGMAVVLDDLPPLMWHAELGKGLVDVWTGTRHRGVQLHDLREAVLQWTGRYEQRAWLRQLQTAQQDTRHDAQQTGQQSTQHDAPDGASPGHLPAAAEDALLQEIARMVGTPFPATASLVARWARGRVRRPAPVESTYCAEVVASAYQAMGLLDLRRPTNWYDPGKFWSGDELRLEDGAVLGDEIAVKVPAAPRGHLGS